MICKNCCLISLWLLWLLVFGVDLLALSKCSGGNVLTCHVGKDEVVINYFPVTLWLKEVLFLGTVLYKVLKDVRPILRHIGVMDKKRRDTRLSSIDEDSILSVGEGEEDAETGLLPSPSNTSWTKKQQYDTFGSSGRKTGRGDRHKCGSKCGSKCGFENISGRIVCASVTCIFIVVHLFFCLDADWKEEVVLDFFVLPLLFSIGSIFLYMALLAYVRTILELTVSTVSKLAVLTVPIMFPFVMAFISACFLAQCGNLRGSLFTIICGIQFLFLGGIVICPWMIIPWHKANEVGQ